MASSAKAPLIAISMGDPAGIGAEVILKAARMVDQAEARLLVIGDRGALEAAAARLGTEAPGIREWRAGQRRASDTIDVHAVRQFSGRGIRAGASDSRGRRRSLSLHY